MKIKMCSSNMKHYWNTFLSSFKLDKRFGYVILADVLFWLLMTALFLSFASLLESQGQALKGGVTSTEQLQQMLLSSPEKAGQFLGELKWFMGILVGGMIILALAFLFLYSLKQKFIWSQILHKEPGRQKYWRWNLLHLAVPFLMAVFVLLGLIVWMLFSLTKNQVIGRAGVLIVVTLYYLFYSLWAKNFTHHYKVFESLGHTFSEWKEKGKSLWAVWFFASAVIFLIFCLSYLLNWQFITFVTGENKHSPWDIGFYHAEEDKLTVFSMKEIIEVRPSLEVFKKE